MTLPILATKLHIPVPRPQFLQRSRLIDQLNAGWQHRKLTLVSAAAGFGKTTLITTWIQQNCQEKERAFHTAWLSLDEDDSELHRFLTYFIVALKTAEPSLGDGVLTMLQLPQLPPPESLLTVLLNEIATLSSKIVLVLDDYHLLDSPVIDQAIAFLLEHQPAQIHLVMTTREDPSLPLARLRVRGELTEIRAIDLRFTPEETAVFLNQVMGLNLTEKDIQALESRTEGWVAGLQLAALALQGQLSAPEQQDVAQFIDTFSGSHHYVLDYLLTEVLNQQPESTQTFLLYTSILDRLCGSLCDAVLDEELANVTSGEATLKTLEQANLFIIPLDNQRQWYRYHHLFGDLLKQRLSSIAQDKLFTLHRRATVWFADNGFEREAIHHALAGEDFERAAALIELIWGEMDDNFQTARWLPWMKALPEEVVAVRPNLILSRAWAHLDLGEMEAAEIWLERAEQCLSSSEEMIIVDERLYRRFAATIASGRSYLTQVEGDIPSTIQYAEQSLALMPEDELLHRALSGGQLGAAYWTSGELDRARQIFVETSATIQKLGHLPFAVAMTYQLASMSWADGRFNASLHVYQQKLQLVQNQEGPPVLGTADLHLWLCEIYFAQGNDSLANEHLAKSELFGEQVALPDWHHRFYLMQAQMKTAERDYEAAHVLLNESEQMFYHIPVPKVAPIAARRARIWLKQGHLTDARQWAESRQLSVTDEISYLQEYEYVTLARLWLAEYENGRLLETIEAALQLLAQLQNAAEAGKRTGSLIELFVLQALAYQLQEDLPRAWPPLKQALTLAESEKYGRVFLDEGLPMVTLLSKLNEQTDNNPRINTFIAELLANLNSQQASSKVDITQKLDPPKPESLLEPLSQRELEVLQLIAQGMSNREISEQLVVALSTVKGHNMKIFGKLQVQRRTEAVARARELGLIEQ